MASGTIPFFVCHSQLFGKFLYGLRIFFVRLRQLINLLVELFYQHSLPFNGRIAICLGIPQCGKLIHQSGYCLLTIHIQVVDEDGISADFLWTLHVCGRVKTFRRAVPALLKPAKVQYSLAQFLNGHEVFFHATKLRKISELRKLLYNLFAVSQLINVNILSTLQRCCHPSMSVFITGVSNTATRSFQSILYTAVPSSISTLTKR